MKAMQDQNRLPHFTEVHTTSPNAAGVPVLEIVRKLEEEKILLRDDRAALKQALYSSDPVRREEVVKALCEVELNPQSRFAVRRLKAAIHQNNSGEVSSSSKHKVPRQVSKLPVEDIEGPEIDHSPRGLLSAKKRDTKPSRRDSSPLSNSPQSGKASNSPSPTQPHRNGPSNGGGEEDDEGSMNVQDTITKLVGECPLYSGNDNFNVLSKVERRLHDMSSKLSAEKLSQMRFAVLVGSGSYNPLTRIHLRTYYLAKQFLETKCGYLVLGSFLSPAHGVTVRERYRTNPLEILPAPHRLAIAQLLVENSQFLSVDPWEMTRRRAMDYLSLLEHVQSILRARCPDFAATAQIFYLCKPNTVVKLSPQALRAQNFNVVAVCRSYESDSLKAQLNSKWNGLIHVVEDSAILDASLDQVTSRKVRDKIKLGESVEQLVGSKINDYVIAHRLQQKLNGLEEWSADERSLPKIMSRPAEPALKSQQSKELDNVTVSSSSYMPSWAKNPG